LLKKVAESLAKPHILKLASLDLPLNPADSFVGTITVSSAVPLSRYHVSTLQCDSGAQQGITSDSFDSSSYENCAHHEVAELWVIESR
jgi:hypothetical protein